MGKAIPEKKPPSQFKSSHHPKKPAGIFVFSEEIRPSGPSLENTVRSWGKPSRKRNPSSTSRHTARKVNWRLADLRTVAPVFVSFMVRWGAVSSIQFLGFGVL
jgi:hypothetical protein